MATTEDKTRAVALGDARPPHLVLVYSGTEVVMPPVAYLPARGATPIGREVPRGIALPGDRKASRHHATIHAAVTGALRVVDERSRNGTLVNGARIAEAVLADGDVLAIGDSYLIVRAPPRDAADADVPALVGTSPAIAAVRAAIARVASTVHTVLIEAETGCGKELAARALHERGRPGGPFVAVNCSAIPETLAESQLFGQLAGTFTGGVARPGLFRAADGGTLFLDEVGELPPAIQPKLLRVLEDRMVMPVGATQAAPCDARVVAATNRDLRAEVAAGRFRADLYARLVECPIAIPPLRERREDVLLLLVHALGASPPALGAPPPALGAPPPALGPALVEALLAHRWPFNVRELNALAVQLRLRGRAGDVLDLALVADRFGAAPPPPAPAPPDPPDDDDGGDDRDPPPDRAALAELLRAHRGVVADVARAMKRSRKQVYRWIALHQLDIAAFR